MRFRLLAFKEMVGFFFAVLGFLCHDTTNNNRLQNHYKFKWKWKLQQQQQIHQQTNKKKSQFPTDIHPPDYQCVCVYVSVGFVYLIDSFSLFLLLLLFCNLLQVWINSRLFFPSFVFGFFFWLFMLIPMDLNDDEKSNKKILLCHCVCVCALVIFFFV